MKSGESTAHRLLKQKVKDTLQKEGYLVCEEIWVYVGRRRFRVDIAGFKGNKSIAIECGKTKYLKMELLRTIFTQVRREYYTSSLNPKREAEKIEARKQTVWVSTLHKSRQTQVPKEVIERLKLKKGSPIVWVEEYNRIFIESSTLSS